MDGNYSPYDFESSLARLDEILAQPRGQFEEVTELPDRDRLTFTNGFYGQWCTAACVGTGRHVRPGVGHRRTGTRAAPKNTRASPRWRALVDP